MSTSDAHRPRYHFTTDNWMNDPIPFWHDGVWHVYFQHNPGAPVWGDMHWGHAVSRDLTHWEAAPIALAPTPDGADRDGVWTGCVTRRPSDGRFLALYTGIPRLKDPFTQVQCAAESDDLYAWRKREAPIIAAPPAGYGPCFRDPQVFDGPDGAVYMVVGGELPDRAGGVAFLYRAEDDAQERWAYLHPVFVGDPATGHDFECPDLFPLGDGRWVMLSSRGATWWHAGRLTDDLRFERDAFGTCDPGAFYAGKTCAGPGGARVLFGWLREERPEPEQVAAGWSGVLSLPRLVTAGPDGLPRFTPAPELRALRAGPAPLFRLAQTFTNGAADEDIPLVELPLQSEARVRLTPLSGEDGAAEPEEFGITLSDEPGRFWEGVHVNTLGGGTLGGESWDAGTSQSETRGEQWRDRQPGEPLDLHVFLDGSVVEIFVNERLCWTQRRYWNPSPDSVTLCLSLLGGTVDVQVEAWRLVV